MENTRYYDPDVDVNGNLTESSSSSRDEQRRVNIYPIQDIGFFGVLGRFGLLKSYLTVNHEAVTYHISSCDLLALWGEASFEASLIVFSASGGSYQADRNREILAASTLIENDLHCSTLARTYMVEWKMAHWRGFEFRVRERVYRHEIRITDIRASITNYMQGHGRPVVELCLSWLRQAEPMWLTADEATAYLEDWLPDLLEEFQETVEFGSDSTNLLQDLPMIVP